MNKLLQGLNSKERDLFLDQCETKNFTQGEVIKKEGQKEKVAFFVKKGEVVVKKSSSEGEMEVATITSDDICFSLTCLIDGGKSLTRVEALQACEIIQIDRKKFFDFCKKNPDIGIKLLTNMAILLAGYLRSADEKIAQMYKTLEEVL